MTILCMYNKDEKHTFINILNVTGLPEDIASRTIKQLIKVKLLLLEKNEPTTDSDQLQKDDNICLNRTFTSESSRVIVNS